MDKRGPCMHVVKNSSTEETWSESNFSNQMSLFRRTTSAGTNPITWNFSSCMISPESVVCRNCRFELCKCFIKSESKRRNRPLTEKARFRYAQQRANVLRAFESTFPKNQLNVRSTSVLAIYTGGNVTVVYP